LCGFCCFNFGTFSCLFFVVFVFVWIFHVFVLVDDTIMIFSFLFYAADDDNDDDAVVLVFFLIFEILFVLLLMRMM